MAYTAKKRREYSKKQVRDEDGHFIPFKDITTESKVQTPFPHTETKKSTYDDPLVSIKVNNPFVKILKWLDYIRKHQTTTFNFKMNIPLIALPVFLMVMMGIFQGFFSLGQYSKKKEIEAIPTPTPIIIMEPTATPAPLSISKLGTITATYQTPGDSNQSPTPVISRYILVDAEDRITFLIIPPTLNMNQYLNRRVLVSGMYDPSHLTLTLKDQSDVEIVW
ncbi:MAG: hypothetical protein O3B87_02680 [bacterium]|nr:hypothetical protein [bacterium]